MSGLAKKKRNRRFATLSARISPKVRTEWLDGKEYWVAPTTIIVEGVHEGSGGAGFYPASEIRKFASSWNNKPVVVYHPKGEDGTFMSAADPKVLHSSSVGFLLFSEAGSSGRNRAETWIDKEKSRRVDPRIEKAFRDGIVMEVSTGLFIDKERKRGRWHGERYSFVARNFRPDHLALLPDLVGACSVGDGCGMLQMNKALKFNRVCKMQRTINSLLASNCKKGCSCKTCKESNMTNTKKARIAKQRKAVINSLIESGMFVKEDRKYLTGLENKRLVNFANALKEKKEKDDQEEEDEEPEVHVRRKPKAKSKTPPEANARVKKKKKVMGYEEGEERPSTANNKKIRTSKAAQIKSFLQRVPTELREFFSDSIQETARNRAEYIEAILDNENNVLEEEELQKMKTRHLVGLAKMAEVEAEEKEEEEEDGSLFGSYLASAGAPPKSTRKKKKVTGNEGDDEFVDEEEEDFVGMEVPSTLPMVKTRRGTKKTRTA